MKKNYILRITIVLAGLFVALSAFSQESLKITSGEINLITGETAQLAAVYLDADSVEQEVLIDWYLVPDTIGTIDETGIFTAEKPGEGYLYAKYETLLDSVEVEIEAVEEEEEEDDEIEDGEETVNWGGLEITNQNIVLEPGEAIQLEALYTDTSGNAQEVKIHWHADPGYLGKADRDGIFTAKHPGVGMLYARYRSLSDSIEITVEGEMKADDEDSDDDGIEDG
ncbi:MAG TPA: hypothetical protein VKA10_02410, partial [Prolixibacteraceae bacterium]|nr:hypothetical protein [Prolixibacteraceae bacterium]